jgi:hypothetical protein
LHQEDISAKPLDENLEMDLEMEVNKKGAATSLLPSLCSLLVALPLGESPRTRREALKCGEDCHYNWRQVICLTNEIAEGI